MTIKDRNCKGVKLRYFEGTYTVFDWTVGSILVELKTLFFNLLQSDFGLISFSLILLFRSTGLVFEQAFDQED